MFRTSKIDSLIFNHTGVPTLDCEDNLGDSITLSRDFRYHLICLKWRNDSVTIRKIGPEEWRLIGASDGVIVATEP